MLGDGGDGLQEGDEWDGSGVGGGLGQGGGVRGGLHQWDAGGM